MEQAKDPEYQKALTVLKTKPLEEQKHKAAAIAKNPEKASFIVERGKMERGKMLKRKHRFDGPPVQEEQLGDEESQIEEEGGEQ